MNIKYLGLETENVWIGKWILVVCYPNRTVHAMWLDAWNIITPSKLKMVYHAYLHSAMVYEINILGNSMDSKKFFFSQRGFWAQYWELILEVFANHFLKLWEHECLHSIYSMVSFCDGVFYNDSLLRPLSSQTEHSRLVVHHNCNSSVISLLSALLVLLRCTCVLSYFIAFLLN